MSDDTGFGGFHFRKALGNHDTKIRAAIFQAHPSFMVFRTNLNNGIMLKRFGFIISIGLSGSAIGQSLIFTPQNEPVEVAASSFGNKAIRMVINAADAPVLAFGSNGHLYVSAWDNASAAFGEPVEIDPDANVFMSDAEGPRMASQGDFLVLTYQISGEWANGARSVHSMDGGLTWSAPVAMVSGADVDHFMPCVAIDSNGNPFAGVKVGNNSASIFEGILRSEDGGSSWLPAVNASANAAGAAVCECCPSQPFWTAGRYYDLVRNNNENIRDFWLMSSADGENWNGALDVDPLDWEVNSCPESGATLAGPVAGTEYLTAFMSAGGPSGQSRVYVSSIDLEPNGGAGEWLSTEPITVSQFDNATQNTPVLGQWQGADGTSIVALAWEQNAGGYDVQLALSAGMDWSLTDVAQNLTSEWSGQHRKPALAFSTDTNGEPLLHLAWQHSSSGTVHYFKGGIQSLSGTICLARPEPEITSDLRGITVQIGSDWGGSVYGLWTADCRMLQSGALTNTGAGSGYIHFPAQHLPAHVIFSLERADGTRWAQQIIRQH